MKRIVLWFMSTFTIVVLLFGYRTSTNSSAASAETSVLSQYGATAPSTASSSASSSTGSTTSSGNTITANGGTATTAAPSSTAGPTSVTTGTASTGGTYAGTVADTRWGPVQVEITVADGTITAVDVLQYPTGNGKDQQINARALPILVQGTIRAQSANIDMVSGATVTSDGYVQSLQSALDQAGL